MDNDVSNQVDKLGHRLLGFLAAACMTGPGVGVLITGTLITMLTYGIFSGLVMFCFVILFIIMSISYHAWHMREVEELKDEYIRQDEDEMIIPSSSTKNEETNYDFENDTIDDI